MDPRTYDAHKQDCGRNPCAVHILGDSQRKDLLGIREYRCIDHCDIGHWHHMAKGCMDPEVLAVLQLTDKLSITFSAIELNLTNFLLFCGGSGLHTTKGSPIYPTRQLQIGV